MSIFAALITLMYCGIVMGPFALGAIIYHWSEIWQNFFHAPHGLLGVILLSLAILWIISSYSFVIYNFKIFYKKNKNKNRNKNKENRSPV